MVTKNERVLVIKLVEWNIFSTHESMRITWIRPKRGFKWLLEWLLKRQVVDNLRHAPACPANHYHKRRLVFKKCSCGAR